MIITQLSVFLENKNGRLADVTRTLSKANVNISALSIAENEDYGVIRMIVDKPVEAIKALKENNLSVRTTEVLGVAIPDVPGALDKILSLLANENIGVAYMYGYSNNATAYMVIKVDSVEKAKEILTKNNVDCSR